MIVYEGETKNKATKDEIERARNIPVHELWDSLGLGTPKEGALVRSPFRKDENPSLQIGGEKNIAYDYATGEKFDTIDIVCRIKNLAFQDAVRFLAGEPLRNLDTPPARPPKPKKDHGIPILPIPDNAPPPPAAHPTLGKPTKKWTYRDADGATLFYVCRFDTTDAEGNQKKTIRPLTLRRRCTGAIKWGWLGVDAPRPLYRLDALSRYPDDAILIAEGEKAADAAQKLYRCFTAATTSPNGAKSESNADWGPLAGREVFVWPDNDDTGATYANDVAQLAHDAGAKAIHILDLSRAWPNASPGDDAADWPDDRTPPALNSDLWREWRPEPNERAKATATKNKLNGKSPSKAIWRMMDEIEPERISWVWPGRIAKGKLTIIAGNPGLGKSQITLDIAARVTTGTRWPDDCACEIGGVILLSAEDDAPDTITPRLIAAGADRSKIATLEAIETPEGRRGFEIGRDLQAIETIMDSERMRDTALIVIDPITAYLGDVDSHKNADVRARLAPFSEFAQKRRVAILAVSHLSKGGAKEAQLRVSGSLAFAAAARAVHIVARDSDDDDDEQLLFLPAKNNIGKDRDGLSFRVVTTRVATKAGETEAPRIEWGETVNVTADEALGDASDAYGGREERNEAREFLEDFLGDGGKTAADIFSEARKAGHSERTIRRAKKELKIKSAKTGLRNGWLWMLPCTHMSGSSQTEDIETVPF